MIIVMDALGRGTHPLEVDGDDDQSVTGHNFFSDTGTGHIVPEQYSIQKEYPKHSVSRKNLFLYSNLRNNFQTNQKLGAF